MYALEDTTRQYEEVLQTLETYVCHLYGSGVTKQIIKQKVNDIQFRLFNRQYKMRDVDTV